MVSWRTKLAIQWILAKIPAGERINHWLQRANRRYTPARLRKRIAESEDVCSYLERFVALSGATVVEVGTGWLMIEPLVMVRRGAGVVHTYDHLPHVRRELTERLAGMMSIDLNDTLQRIHYHAPADARQTGLPDGSVDLFFSYNVLEHIPPRTVRELVLESKRLLRRGGVAFHAIGLHDHYSEFDSRISRVNFLQYSDPWWNFWVQNRISYHNRLRLKEFLELFRAAGAEIIDVRTAVDEADVTTLKNGFPLAERFRGMTPEELAPHYMEVVYRFSQ